MVKYYHKKRHIQWRRQAVDNSKMVAAPLGGNEAGPNPKDRAKAGSKRHLWVDQRGAPLSIHITSANAHDVTAILNLLNRPIARRPKNGDFIDFISEFAVRDNAANTRQSLKN